MYKKSRKILHFSNFVFFLTVVGLFDFAEAGAAQNGTTNFLDMRMPTDSLGLRKPKVVSIYGGLSYGAESPILGFPALEIRIRPLRELPYVSTFYVGCKASAWIIIAGVGNVGVESGYQYKWLTIDASLTYSVLSSWEASRTGDGGWYTIGPAKKMTFNPKIGVSLYAFSLKIGPAFKVKEYLRDADKENQNSPDLLKYFLDDDGITSFNVEVGVGIHLF